MTGRPTDQPATADVEADPRRWRALTVCLSAGFMTLLDVSIVNVALPSIQRSLVASDSQLQWVVAGYSLAFGLVLVPAGRIGDARGRRRVFMVALAAFVLTSAAAGLAQSAAWLVVARLAQGVAAGVLNPQISGVIQDLFRGAERGRAFGRLGTTIGLSTAVGPLAGGLILGVAGVENGWRWVFLVNVPVGAVALLLAWRLLPVDGRGTNQERLDPVGSLLLGAAVLLVLLPVVQERQWPGPWPWLLVPVGLGVGWLFLRWERSYADRGRPPLIDMSLLRVRSYATGSLLAAVYFAGFTSQFFVLTLFLQLGEGYSPLAAGLTATPFALGSAAAATVGGRLVDRAGLRLVVGGLVLVVTGLAAVNVAAGLAAGSRVGWVLAVPLLVAGVGSGLVISPNRTLTLAEVPVARGGVAAGVLQVGQRIGAAMGIAAVGAVFFGVQSARGSFTTAFQVSLWVSIGFLALALLLALADVRRGRPVSS